MKKSIIALAIAGAMTAPAIAMADATLYGSFRMNLTKADKASASFANNATRVGIRGTVDLGLEDTKGIFHWEQGLDTEAGALAGGRYASLGATGSWGTAVGGRIDHFTWNYAGGVTDLFASGSGDILSVDYLGSGAGRADRRQSNTIAYVSPNMSGFQAGIGGVFMGDAGTQKDNEIDGYNLGAQYSAAGLTVGAGYGAVKAAKSANVYAADSNLWSLAATYKIEALTLSAAYERAKDKTTNTTDKGYSVAGRYEVDGLGATLAYSQVKETNQAKGTRVQAEVYNRLGRGMVSAGYVDNNKNVRGGNTDRFYVGYRLDF
ncbi:hypothetical protein DN062_07190 [Nitrincola tibetensis]|uniref:Porin domain-containing protein n=1 Tax=Nitrincola tibetensis TaxID=2219697 RepID=A0A364NN77_9GAMM|nr:porin [Nitrincola tibetensis]RAU18551.1 hypothetical protein DN062_07190 [Nitrincola tibetensis]